jgi:hypothetical protein
MYRTGPDCLCNLLVIPLHSRTRHPLAQLCQASDSGLGVSSVGWLPVCATTLVGRDAGIEAVSCGTPPPACHPPPSPTFSRPAAASRKVAVGDGHGGRPRPHARPAPSHLHTGDGGPRDACSSPPPPPPNLARSKCKPCSARRTRSTRHPRSARVLVATATTPRPLISARATPSRTGPWPSGTMITCLNNTVTLARQVCASGVVLVLGPRRRLPRPRALCLIRGVACVGRACLRGACARRPGHVAWGPEPRERGARGSGRGGRGTYTLASTAAGAPDP